MSTGSFQEIAQQIEKQAYAAIPFAVTKNEFQKAIDIFFTFLELPLETKQQAYFRIRPEDRGSEVGYKRYLRDEGQTDNREYVHYHRLAEERFKEVRMRIPEFDALLKSMKQIHDEAMHSLKQVMQLFDQQFPGIYQKFFSEEKMGDFYLRFLKYDRMKPGDFLAKGHYDRGGCTLALAESAPGLRMGVDDLHLQEVVHQEGEALFMPGLTFHEVTSPAFKPTWHDVIQKGEDAYTEEAARWAIVLFADPHELPLISYTEAHTPRRI